MTPRQERFVQEYLLDLNATQAAIRAGYSEKTANEQGAQLLKKPEIAAAIDAAKAERADRADIDAFWVLRRLVDEAEADLADLFDKETGQVKPVHEWPEIFRKGLVQSVESEELYEGSGQDREHIGRVRKLRFSDRHKRTELIGKHVDVNAFQDLIKHNMHEDLAKRLERAAERWGRPQRLSVQLPRPMERPRRPRSPR
ncbi:terminase small subunit [Fodinicurvata halophila]|uniref:terminase small subunit n=1 Tax=Fodinicurvata halophila TaxID=1419723 RepID=UPI0036297A5D